ncbi:MAG: hypothetical protein K2W78_11065 [Xanthobacteraceae bacterium]|nr:hypothetical protein [Xanthobacteraceae bacterium]
MMKTIVGGAALCLAFSVMSVSAQAASCAGKDMTKAEDRMEGMSDVNPSKPAIAAELATASSALSEGKGRDCSIHLTKAVKLEAKAGI